MSRFYNPVRIAGGWGGKFAIRGEGGHRHRAFCADLELTWDQAERLCDVLEEARSYALNEREDEMFAA